MSQIKLHCGKCKKKKKKKKKKKGHNSIRCLEDPIVREKLNPKKRVRTKMTSQPQNHHASTTEVN
nr:uncharacterized protein LOC109163970 [Ipomoea batatas]